MKLALLPSAREWIANVCRSEEESRYVLHCIDRAVGSSSWVRRLLVSERWRWRRQRHRGARKKIFAFIFSYQDGLSWHFRTLKTRKRPFQIICSHRSLTLNCGHVIELWPLPLKRSLHHWHLPKITLRKEEARGLVRHITYRGDWQSIARRIHHEHSRLQR